MRIRPTLNSAPDGFSTSPRRGFFAAVANAASGNGPAAAMSEGQRRRHTDHEQYHHNQDGYDEGLVHSHGWAATTR